jgi:hypothetical protein
MGIEVVSTATGNALSINAAKEALAALTLTEANAGFAALVTEGDPGTFTARKTVAIEGDDDYRLRVGSDSLLFQETFSGAALNSAVWQSTVTTFTTAVSGSYLKLNSGASVAANGVARVTSYKSFMLTESMPIYFSFPFQIVAASVGIANTTWEAGLFFAATTAAPTDGVFLRMNAAGELRLVQNFAGVETQSDVIDYSASGINLLVNTDYSCIITIGVKLVTLWINNQRVAFMPRQGATPSLTASSALVANFRIYNGATPPASATSLWIGYLTISQCALGNAFPLPDTISIMGGGGYQGQSGGTMGQTANWTNSTEPVAATLSNTAAGYTTFGGQWSFAAPAGAATDFALFAFQVPAAAAGSHNKNLVIRGIRIDAVNSGAAVATTATILQWAMAVGSTAVSLATAEAATTRAPRRIALGVQSLLVGDPIGGRMDSIDWKFDCPIPAEPGTYVHVIVRVPVGTATASQVIRGTCTFDAQYY